jgi:hypothetical protein
MAGGEGDRSRNPKAGFDRARRAAVGVAGIDSAAIDRAAFRRGAGRGHFRSIAFRSAVSRPRSAPASAEGESRRSSTGCTACCRPASCAAAGADRGSPGSRCANAAAFKAEAAARPDAAGSESAALAADIDSVHQRAHAGRCNYCCPSYYRSPCRSTRNAGSAYRG